MSESKPKPQDNERSRFVRTGAILMAATALTYGGDKLVNALRSKLTHPKDVSGATYPDKGIPRDPLGRIPDTTIGPPSGANNHPPTTGLRPKTTLPPVPAPGTQDTIEPGGPLSQEAWDEINKPSYGPVGPTTSTTAPHKRPDQ